MNINLDHSGNFEDLPDLFLRDGSPYVSPFMGSLSLQFHGSNEELESFKLENNIDPIGGAELGYENLLINEEDNLFE